VAMRLSLIAVFKLLIYSAVAAVAVVTCGFHKIFRKNQKGSLD
jgi:hypothetical protein